MTIKLLLAEDQLIVAEGLRSLLEHSPEINSHIVGVAENGRKAVEMAKNHRPDVIVMDISMPDLNGIDATRLILEDNPNIKILALSVHKESSFVMKMFQAGAKGYILKESFFQECVTALKKIMNDEFYFGNGLNATIADILKDKEKQIAQKESVSHLSLREREVLQLVAEGKSSKEIAAILNRSVKTVEMHRFKIMEKLNIHSIAELTRYAIQEGITAL